MEYNNIKVFIAPKLITLLSSKRARGMALMWCILIRQPDSKGFVRSSNGKRHLDKLLKHEYTHIVRQKERGIIWFWYYLTNKRFRLMEEAVARNSENN